MAKGICVICGKEVGGLFKPPGGACPGCGKLYCLSCAPKTGKILKTPVCPTCGRALKYG